MTAPERIWATGIGKDPTWHWWHSWTVAGATEYVRADLTRATPMAEAMAVPTETQIAAAVNAVWSEMEDSKTQRWTLRKEHIHNAIATALRAIAAAKGDTEIPADAENGRATVSRIKKGDVSQSSAD